MRPIAALLSTLAAVIDEERDRAVLWLPVFMGAGVLGYYALRMEPAAWLGVAVTVPAIALAVRWPFPFSPIAAAALGFASAQFATARAPPMEWHLPTHATIITGTVRAVEALPEGRRNTLRPAFLDAAATPMPRAVRVRLRANDDNEVATGDTVRVRALIRPPSMPAYPGAWDLQRDAFYNGLGASGYALAPVERLQAGMPTGPMRLVQRLREIIDRRVTAVIPGSAGAVSATLLTGSAMAIPLADHQAFRDSGLAHLLAVAGLHIGIVMGFALMLSRFALAQSERVSLFWPTRKIAACCALLAGAGYMVMTGMHVPIMRSFVMASLFTLALMTDRRPVSVRGLGLAAAVLMLVAPHEVVDVSFQMSFSAVLALIAGYEALRPWLRRLHGPSRTRRLLSHVVALALTSALAGSASAPYGAYHFGQVQAYFVLANMVAVPLTAIWVMPAGLIAVALMPLHLEALALVPMGWGAEVVLWIARASAALPAATLQVPHPPAWGLILFSLGLAWLGLWRTRWRLLGVAAMLAGVASPLLVQPPDLLISDDARLIAMRTRDGVYLQQTGGGSRFIRDAWASYWAVPVLQELNTAPNEGRDGVVSCGDDACFLRPYADRPGVLLARGAQHPDHCKDSAVIVSAEPARGLCPKPWPKLVDRFTVWRFGAAAIWLNPGGAAIVLDRQYRGQRPWVPPVPQSRKTNADRAPPAPLQSKAEPEAPHAEIAARTVQ